MVRTVNANSYGQQGHSISFFFSFTFNFNMQLRYMWALFANHLLDSNYSNSSIMHFTFFHKQAINILYAHLVRYDAESVNIFTYYNIQGQ